MNNSRSKLIEIQNYMASMKGFDDKVHYRLFGVIFLLVAIIGNLIVIFPAVVLLFIGFKANAVQSVLWAQGDNLDNFLAKNYDAVFWGKDVFKKKHSDLLLDPLDDRCWSNNSPIFNLTEWEIENHSFPKIDFGSIIGNQLGFTDIFKLGVFSNDPYAAQVASKHFYGVPIEAQRLE